MPPTQAPWLLAIIDQTAGSPDYALPDANDSVGRVIVVKVLPSSVTTRVRAPMHQLIDGSTTYTVNPGASAAFQARNGNWYVASDYAGINVIVGGDFSTTAVTLPQLTADQDNYDTGPGTFFRISSNADRVITGFRGGYSGRWMLFHNFGSFNISIRDQGSAFGSLAPNRVKCPRAADIVMFPNSLTLLAYDPDPITPRWSSSLLQDRIVVGLQGTVLLNVTGAELATTAVAGFTSLPTCNGTPTGVPVPHTGMAPFVLDRANRILYFYDFAGAAWTNVDSGGGGGGSFSLTSVTKDLGTARRTGTFDITGLAGLVTNKPVLIVQLASPITSKGDARDEPEMDLITLTGYVVDANTIRAYWSCAGGQHVAVGEYNFGYAVGA